MHRKFALAMVWLYSWCMNIPCIQVPEISNYSEMQSNLRLEVQAEQSFQEANTYDIKTENTVPYNVEQMISPHRFKVDPVIEMSDDVFKPIEKEYVFDVTDEEVTWLECLVAAEDGNEQEDYQVAVAASILNRLESQSHDFKNLLTLEDVIFQNNQYSTVRDGKFYHNSTEIIEEMVSEETKSAVQRALYGEDPTEALLKEEAERLGLDVEQYVGNGATFFYSPQWCSEEVLSARRNIKVKIQYGDHIFYAYWD